MLPGPLFLTHRCRGMYYFSIFNAPIDRQVHQQSVCLSLVSFPVTVCVDVCCLCLCAVIIIMITIVMIASSFAGERKRGTEHPSFPMVGDRLPFCSQREIPNGVLTVMEHWTVTLVHTFLSFTQALSHTDISRRE